MPQKSLIQLMNKLKIRYQININIWIDGYKNSREQFKGNEDKTSEVYKISKDAFDNANIIKMEENIGIARMYAKAESYSRK